MKQKSNFSIGDRIEIVASIYTEPLIGLHGVIKAIYGNGNRKISIGVIIDDKSNAASSYGYFYFSAEQLVLEEQEEYIMDGVKKVVVGNYINKDYSKQEYEFACFNEDVKADDILVVMSLQHGMSLIKVTEVRDYGDEDLYREVICKADTSEYDARVEARERKKLLKNKMHERMAKLQEIAMFEVLAESDEEMRELLREYKEV